jgi:hypothetical protein
MHEVVRQGEPTFPKEDEAVKPVQVVLVVAVVLAAGITGYFALQWSGHAPSTSGSLVSQNNLPHPPSVGGKTPFRPKGSIAKSSPAAAYRQQFAQATSYYEFVRNAFPAAKGGNPEAQFYISEALGFCKQGYEMFFSKRSPDLPTPSLEEQIGKFTSHFSNLIGVIRNVHGKCHDLMENDVAQWGTREDWLVKATDANLPAAQARTAETLLGDEVLHRPPTIQSQEQDPRALLRSALAAGDPTALMVAGGFLRAVDEMNSPRLNDAQARDQRTENRLAWWLLACNRGYDCSENSPWFSEVCATDPVCRSAPTDAVAYIHQVADLRHYADLDQRADEFSAKVAAQAWSDLGLGGS